MFSVHRQPALDRLRRDLRAADAHAGHQRLRQRPDDERPSLRSSTSISGAQARGDRPQLDDRLVADVAGATGVGCHGDSVITRGRPARARRRRRSGAGRRDALEAARDAPVAVAQRAERHQAAHAARAAAHAHVGPLERRARLLAVAARGRPAERHCECQQHQPRSRPRSADGAPCLRALPRLAPPQTSAAAVRGGTARARRSQSAERRRAASEPRRACRRRPHAASRRSASAASRRRLATRVERDGPARRAAQVPRPRRAHARCRRLRTQHGIAEAATRRAQVRSVSRRACRAMGREGLEPSSDGL